MNFFPCIPSWNCEGVHTAKDLLEQSPLDIDYAEPPYPCAPPESTYSECCVSTCATTAATHDLGCCVIPLVYACVYDPTVTSLSCFGACCCGAVTSLCTRLNNEGLNTINRVGGLYRSCVAWSYPYQLTSRVVSCSTELGCVALMELGCGETAKALLGPWPAGFALGFYCAEGIQDCIESRSSGSRIQGSREEEALLWSTAPDSPTIEEREEL